MIARRSSSLNLKVIKGPCVAHHHQLRTSYGKFNTELITSDHENTAMLGHQLLEVDETVPDPQESDCCGVEIQEGTSSLCPVREELPSQGSSVLRMPQKSLLDEIVVQPLPTKRAHRTTMISSS